MSENKNKINNNEIISFTEEENQIIDPSQNKVKKEINIDEILKKEDDILKKKY